jgi:TolB-like protein/DNA-binding winged helix-turn-helix (wHTH) protein/Tfp pilus assembly protein PilF
MNATDRAAIRIGVWRVDPALDEISKDGATVKLERRAMQLLLYLSKHADQVVSVDQLLDEVWVGVVVTPDSVYHAVAALRRLLGDDTRQPTYIANVPRRGYRLIAPVAPWVDGPRLPLENILRPAIEPARTIHAVTKTASGWRRFAIALSIAVTLALGYFLFDRFWLSKHATTAEHQPTDASTVIADRSIAVLPFVDMSEKKDQEYFADGMAEEVIDLLAKVPSVRVIGRTSSFQFKGKSPDLRTLGSTLGAAYVVEGSVRKSGERLRVTAQLIDAQDGSPVWSESYDEQSGDVLMVQGQIAAGIVRALQVTIGADDLRSRPMLKSAEAYDLYLRGRHAFDRFDRAGLETASGYFQQALELDPSFIRAAEWLAMAHETLPVPGFVPPREGFGRARASVEHALKMNPESGMMHSLLAHIYAIYDWDWRAATEEGNRALALEPRDSVVLTNVGQVDEALGQWDEATRLFTAAMALDPLSAPAHFELGLVRMCTGRFTEAEAEFRAVLKISPTWDSVHEYVGWALLAEGRLEAALGEIQQTGPGRDLGLATVYHAMGRNAESDAALARYSKGHADDDAYDIAAVHAYRGEPDEAFAWLGRAYDQKDSDLYQIKCDPLLKNLEPDPRYKAFMRKMKLPE